MRVVGKAVGPVWVIMAMLATLLTLSASPAAAADGADCLLTKNGTQVSLTWNVPGGVKSSTAIRSGTSLADTSWRETVPNPTSSWTGDLRVDEVYLVKTKINGVRTEIPCNEQPDQPDVACSYGSNEVDANLTTIRWNVGDEGRVAVRSGPSADDTTWRVTLDAATGEWTTRLSAEQAWTIRHRVGATVTTYECAFEDREVEPAEPPPVRPLCTVRIIEGKANLSILVGAGPVAIRSGASVDNTRWRETVGRGEGWSGDHTPGHVYVLRYKTEGENREVLCEPGEADGVFFANHMPNTRAEFWAELPNGGIVYSRFTTEFGREPWVTDGTEAGTMPLGDLRPGGSSSPSSFIRFGDFVFFTASTAETGRELWRTDGTAAGTVVLDLIPGPDSVGPFNLTALDGHLFFAGFNSSWVSDGTIEGTRELPSPIRGVLRSAHATDSGTYIRTTTNDRDDLWWIDDRLVEAHLVREGVANSSNSISTDGDRLFLAGDSVSVFGGDGVLLTTLPLDGEHRFRVPAVSPAPGGAYILRQRLDDSWTVWFSDGTAAGTEVLLQTARPEDGGPVFLLTVGTVGGRFVYSRFFEDRQEDIWSVGVESPTPERIRGLEATRILRSQAINDDELFIDSGIVTDGTTAGTTVYDLPGFSFVYYWNGAIYLRNQVGMFGINR